MLKKILKILLIIIIAVIAIVAIYLAYLFISYHRIDDNVKVEIEGNENTTGLKKDQVYTIASANLGFGAYSDDYSFFMDGGTESWAYSKEAATTNINSSIDIIKQLKPNIFLLQEVDLDSTRTYHVNEKELIIDNISESYGDNLTYTFCVNYDSPFLMYPIYQPHGKSKAGMLTISTVGITDSIRRSLPIDEEITKMIDLDRCYCKNTIPVEDGKNLILYNVHLSAYAQNPETAINQIKMLNEDMKNEFEAGNYIIAGGDMNKDVLGDSQKYFGKSTEDQLWAVAFPTELLEKEFTLIKPLDESNPVPSCRNADTPYNEDSFVLTVDGFIVSSNVDVEESNVIDTGFKYSDHNPIYMKFKLK